MDASEVNPIEEELTKVMAEWPMSRLRELREKLGHPTDFYNEEDIPMDTCQHTSENARWCSACRDNGQEKEIVIQPIDPETLAVELEQSVKEVKDAVERIEKAKLVPREVFQLEITI